LLVVPIQECSKTTVVTKDWVITQVMVSQWLLRRA